MLRSGSTLPRVGATKKKKNNKDEGDQIRKKILSTFVISVFVLAVDMCPVLERASELVTVHIIHET
jgi:hypothetical protein